MITEYLREEQLSHTISRVIVARHEVSEQFLCEIKDSNGKHIRAFKLNDHGATGEVDSMPYVMLRDLLVLRPAPMAEYRRPDASEMARIKAKSNLQIAEEDEKFIFLGAPTHRVARFYNDSGTLITSINMFDDIKVILSLAGGSMFDKKGDITFDHLMDSFELPVRSPFLQK